jgi:caffeoyl-CoA O-methyltransferase
MIRGYGLRDPGPRRMTPRSFLLTPELAEHVRASSEPLDAVAADLVAETAALAERGEAPATFQIAVEQGVLMQLLTRALGVPAGRRDRHLHRATRAVHRPRPARGRLAAVPGPQRGVDRRSPGRYWERAGVADRVELRLGEALELLRALPAEPVLRPALRRRRQDRLRRLRRRAAPRGCVRTGWCLLDNTAARRPGARPADRRRPCAGRAQRRAGRRPALETRCCRWPTV